MQPSGAVLFPTMLPGFAIRVAFSQLGHLTLQPEMSGLDVCDLFDYSAILPSGSVVPEL